MATFISFSRRRIGAKAGCGSDFHCSMQVVLQGCRTSLRLVEALKLQEQLKIPTKSLSEGVKRKAGNSDHC